jgi:beta-N-acetylhexosaminidase
MASTSSAHDALGELLILGFEGPELSEETLAFISQGGIGGVLIQATNFESPAQLAELSNQIQDGRRKNMAPLWIAVDHEGGKAQRLKKHFTKIPDAQAIAAMDSPKLAFEIAEVLAKELKAVGINLNLAPVADIATNPRNPQMVPRSFGNDEETVSKMISGIVRGQRHRARAPSAWNPALREAFPRSGRNQHRPPCRAPKSRYYA